MLDRLLRDERGALVAEYALLLLLACSCFAVLTFKLGDKVSAAIYHVAKTIGAEAALIGAGADAEP